MIHLKLTVSNTTKFLLYSGNMGQLQDMETLISFLKLNKDQPQTLTILCGHGKKFADVKTAIEDHRIENVKMFEFLTGTDYADVLKLRMYVLHR